MTRPYRIFEHYVQGKSIVLFLGDLLLIMGSLYAAGVLRLVGVPASWLDIPHGLPTVMVFALVGTLTFYVSGLYEAKLRDRNDLILRAAAAGSVWGALYLALNLSAREPDKAWWCGLPEIALATAAIIVLRTVCALLTRTNPFRERVLFLGATPTAEHIIGELEVNHPGYEIVGFVDDRPADQVALSNGFRVLGTTWQLSEIATGCEVGTIVVCLTERRGSFPLKPILDCKLRGIRIEDWPAFYEKLTGKIIVQNLRPSWLVFSEGFKRTAVTRMAKHVVDLALATLFLVIGWPIFVLVALAIRLDSPGPIFFRQERVGEQGRPFTLLKFRTMVQDAELRTGPVWAADDDPRITRVGRWLRKTRLDEFPQIWNVFKGEMSFIGPRPERPHFVVQLQEKIPYYAERHSVKPGITGWAQVRCPYAATIEDSEEKLQYDLYYVKNMSSLLDIDILLSTIRVVLFGRGAR
jgi:sugar transferase (PEP-CTERM system associated)